jgi:OmpA-OmpF porin, OOP family
MKQLNKILIAVVLIIGLNAQAQDSKNPWAVSFGMNALDTRTSAGGGSSFLDSHFSDAFSVKNNWNIVPTISYIGVSKYVGDNFSIGLSASFNKVSKYVSLVNSNYVVSNPGDVTFYGIDANVKYSFQTLIKSKVIDPSISLGLGYSVLGDNTYQTVSPGAGVVVWVSENIGLELSSKYKKSFESREFNNHFNAPSMLQHSVGLVIKFGE